MIYCALCEAPLTNGLDTYGKIGKELCWKCYSDFSLASIDRLKEQESELEECRIAFLRSNDNFWEMSEHADRAHDQYEQVIQMLKDQQFATDYWKGVALGYIQIGQADD